MTEEEIERLDALFSDNLDLIPVSNWGFSQDVFESLKAKKHSGTNQQLSRTERKTLNKRQKQKIARGLGVTNHVVSDIIEHMQNTRQADIMPKNPNRNFVKPNVEDVQQSKEGKNKHSGSNKKSKNKLEKKLKKTDANLQSNLPEKATEEKRQDGINKQKKNELPSKKQKILSKLEVNGTNKKSEPSNLPNNGTIECSSLLDSETKQGLANAKRKLTDCDVVDDVEAKKLKIISNLALPNLDTKKKLSKKAKQDDFHGRDYERLLKKAEKRCERLDSIREKDVEKAKAIENNIKWDRVMKRAAGEKVKDDVELLKKGLKMKAKRKARSEQKWKEREKNVENKKFKRQEKRQTNIKKRHDDKIKNKQKKRLKKGS